MPRNRPVISQRCKTHNTRINPDSGVIDIPGSGAINETGNADGIISIEHEFSCGCVITAAYNTFTEQFNTVELDNQKAPV